MRLNILNLNAFLRSWLCPRLLNVNCILVVKLRNWFDFCGKYSIFTVFAEVFNFIVFLYVSCRSSIMSRTIRSYNQLFITDMPTNISNQIVKQNLHFDVDLLNEKSVQSFWKLYLHFDALNFLKFCPILKRPFWQSTIWKKAWSMDFKDILNFDCYESLRVMFWSTIFLLLIFQVIPLFQYQFTSTSICYQPTCSWRYGGSTLVNYQNLSNDWWVFRCQRRRKRIHQNVEYPRSAFHVSQIWDS